MKKQKIKIGFLAPFKSPNHPEPSGDREIARRLIAFFENQGCEVKIITERTTLGLSSSIWIWFLCLLSLPRAIYKMQTFKPDILFTYHSYYKAPDLFGPLLSKLFKKTYYVFEGIYSRKHAYNLKTFIGWLVNRIAIQSAAAVFCDKENDKEGLLFLKNKNDVISILPAVDLNFFSPNIQESLDWRKRNSILESIPVVTTVVMLRPGRKTEGVLFLIDCLEEIKKRGYEFYWVLIAGGPELNKITKVANEKLGHFAHILGEKTAPEVRDALRAADIFAFPGIDESIGMVYIEAQACGCPVVAFNNGGIPEVVLDKKTGYLTELRDRRSHIEAIESLLKDEKLRETFSTNARQYAVEKFDRNKNYQIVLSKITNE